MYESFPETKTLETPFFTISGGNYYDDVKTAVWVYTGKIIPLLILTLWFTTCRHWWYHVILIPIAMYSFQLFGAINAEADLVDEVEIYWLIPIMMFIIPFVYLIRIKLMDKLVYGIDLKKIDAELEEYKRKEQEQLNSATDTQK